MTFTGASGTIPRNDIERQEKHAELFYEEIRKRTGDVKTIAKNTGFFVRDIKKIKKHIFFDEHDLGEDIPTRFDPSYDMAISWQRLIDGKNIQEMDIILLKHELYELNLMSQGIDYDTAHHLTNQKYNYVKYTKELDEKEGVL